MPFDRQSWFAREDWASEAVLYQIDVRLFGGDYHTDMPAVIAERDEPGDELLAAGRSGRFGQVTEQLDYLVELGINTVWIMPPFPRGIERAKGPGSPYAVRSFSTLNPEFGSEEEFAHLVEESHRRHLKVIVGFVPNHMAPDNEVLAQHRDDDRWFYQSIDGELYNDLDWWDTCKLNYRNPKVRAYITECLLDLVYRFKVDGFRCDVAFMPTATPLSTRLDPRADQGGWTTFWQEAIPCIRAQARVWQQESQDRPGELFFLAEVYYYYEAVKLLRDGFDAVYHQYFLDRQTDKFSLALITTDIQEQMRQELTDLARIWQDATGEQAARSRPLTLRFAENHDYARAAHRCGGLAQSRVATAAAFTTACVPMLLYGQEYGALVRPTITEAVDYTVTREHPGRLIVQALQVHLFPGKRERQTSYRWYRRLLELRQRYDCLRCGEFYQINVRGDGGFSDTDVVAFVRWLPGELVLVALNYNIRGETRMVWLRELWPSLHSERCIGWKELLEQAGLPAKLRLQDLWKEGELALEAGEVPILELPSCAVAMYGYSG